MDTSDMRCLFKPLPLLMDDRVRMSTRASPCAPHLYSACMCASTYIQERRERVREGESEREREGTVAVCRSFIRDVYGLVYVALRARQPSSSPRPPKSGRWASLLAALRREAMRTSNPGSAVPLAHTHPVNLENAQPRASSQCNPSCTSLLSLQT